jgi:DNA protecting protein DprA
MRSGGQSDLILLTAAYLHVPPRRLRVLVRGEDPSLLEWLGGDAARKVSHARHLAREAAVRLQKLHAVLVTIADEQYPAGLRDLDDPPAWLYVRGTLPKSGLAIVGSRTPPAEAAAFAQALARECGMPVVSGLALGIDAAAHRGALDASLPTVAYVGTGLGVTYPAEHRALEEEIAGCNGAVVCERLPDEPATKWALVHRDRLQAAHARASILVASDAGGGAMQTMRFAKTLHRPRFALDAKGPQYSGNALAIAGGAVALPANVPDALKIIRTTLAKGEATLAAPSRSFFTR